MSAVSLRSLPQLPPQQTPQPTKAAPAPQAAKDPEYGGEIEIGQFSALGEAIDSIDSDGNDVLTSQEISTAADSNSDGKVTDQEADSFIEQMRAVSGDDEVSSDVFDKMRSAAMDPVSNNLEFDISRARYASVFCTRF